MYGYGYGLPKIDWVMLVDFDVLEILKILILQFILICRKF